jgi:hypothetical protein
LVVVQEVEIMVVVVVLVVIEQVQEQIQEVIQYHLLNQVYQVLQLRPQHIQLA